MTHGKCYRADQADLAWQSGIDLASWPLSRVRKATEGFLAGNGGSAVDAQRIAGECVSRFAIRSPGVAGLCRYYGLRNFCGRRKRLRLFTSVVQQLQAVGRKGDVFIACSSSGRTRNIFLALQQARAIGIVTVGLTGSSDEAMRSRYEHLLQMPSGDTLRIQEGHALIGHIRCGPIEAALLEARL